MVSVFIVFRLVVSPTMTENEREVFIGGVQQTCFPRQRSDAVNDALTDTQLQEYCSCIALSMGKWITKKDIRYLEVNKSMPPSAAEECR